MKVTPTGDAELDAMIANFKIKFGDDKNAEVCEALGEYEALGPLPGKNEWGYKSKKTRTDNIKGRIFNLLKNLNEGRTN